MNLLLAGLFLFLGAAPARAAPADKAARLELFAQAAKRYDAGDYRGAAAAYLELSRDQPGNPALHYNLANAHFKAGELGRAIAQYQRAFDLRPRDADTRHNFEFALKRAGEELVPPGVPPALFSVFYLLSERELAGLQWLGCWAVLILASLLLARKPSLEEQEESAPRGALYSWGKAALLFWLVTGSWWLARKSLEPARPGVIVSATAEIRNGPGDNFNVSFTAPEGRRVQILSENAEWLEIGVLKEGAKGWLRADSVEKI